MGLWLNGKSLKKHHCLKKKNFIGSKYKGYYRCRLHACKKSLQRIYKDFDMKKLEEYHDLYLKRDTLLLAKFLKRLERCA